MWRNHGFAWDYHSMYAYLSQGTEMLFLVAFTFGRHSAAALVHFTYLCTLPLLMVCWGRRFGFAEGEHLRRDSHLRQPGDRQGRHLRLQRSDGCNPDLCSFLSASSMG